MFVLIAIVIFATAFAFFATQNTGTISLYFGSYTIDNIPVFLVVLGSLGFSILVAAFIYILHSLSSSLTISEKDEELKTVRKDLNEITKEAHKLELENTKLKAKLGVEVFDEDSI